MSEGVTELALLAAWEGGYGRPAPDRAVALAALVSGLPADEIADLALGQCDLLLLRLREECFGPTLDGLAQCPGCGVDLDVGLDLAELRCPADRHRTSPDADGSVLLDGDQVPLRSLTVRDLLVCGGDRSRLLARCLAAGPALVTGGQSAPAWPGEPGILDAIEAQLDLLDPQAAVEINLDCPECGASWRAPVDVTEFVWSEIDRFARRLLYDVHTLASAYGWSEADVFAVSPVRRRFYLEVCAS